MIENDMTEANQPFVEMEKPEGWLKTLTHPDIVVALLAVFAFLFFITSNWTKFSPK